MLDVGVWIGVGHFHVHGPCRMSDVGGCVVGCSGSGCSAEWGVGDGGMLRDGGWSMD